MYTRWQFSAGSEIQKIFHFYSFATWSTSYVYFYLKGICFSSCSSLEHLLPPVNLQQSCELRASRFFWEAQGQLLTRPKTLTLSTIPWHMWFRMRWVPENRTVRLHFSFLNTARTILRIWFHWMTFSAGQMKPWNMPNLTFPFASPVALLIKSSSGPLILTIGNGWRPSHHSGMMWSCTN